MPFSAGDFPQIDVIEVFDNPVPAVAFTEDTKGIPDVDYVALKLGEAVSLPFSVTSLDAAGVCKRLFFLLFILHILFSAFPSFCHCVIKL